MSSDVIPQRQHLLIVHHEGNVFNNPNLYGLVNILGERFYVDVLVPPRMCNRGQAFPSKYARLIEYLPLFGDFRFMNNSEVLQEFCARYLRKNYAFIFGVDRGGLILASLISSALGSPPCGMLSYEIFFEDETSSRFKAVERDASVDLCLVIVSDEIRGEQLAEENKVPAWAEMLHIPVSAA